MKAFQSFTPRTKRFVYDSLAQDTGCQVISGATYFASRPFIELCVFEHNDASEVFNRLPTENYTQGPNNTSGAMPWTRIWAAWVGSNGVRVGKYVNVTPPDDLKGTSSSLFPTDKPSKVAIGFTAGGEIAIAIQKTPTSIEVKWFSDASGLVESVRGQTFLGISPVLFSNGLVHKGDDPGETDLALYYLRPETPKTLYVRFEREWFGVERIVDDNLPVSLASLIGSVADGNRQILYARDSLGRDVTLYSDHYPILIDGDAVPLALSIISGRYDDHGMEIDGGGDEGTLTLSIESGSVNEPIQSPPSALSDDKQSLTLSIQSGEYELA